MTIRFSISATSTEAVDQPVKIDLHHVSIDGTWFDHPIRSNSLAIGQTLHLLAHIALGMVLHKGNREELCLAFVHDDPQSQNWLEITVINAPEAGSSLLPGAITLTDGPCAEAIEIERIGIPPGRNASITLYHGTTLQIREVQQMSERCDG